MIARRLLVLSVATALSLTTATAMAQVAPMRGTTRHKTPTGVAHTSNTTAANATRRAVHLEAVRVQATALRVSGWMVPQTAPKAVSTITRRAIKTLPPGSNPLQLLASVPGVNTSTMDFTGLPNGNVTLRGFDGNEIGITINGAPVTDPGTYEVYPTQYGDAADIGNITVLQGWPDVTMPDAGASGGHIAWSTVMPSHHAGVDVSQTWGSHDYRRSFVRVNTGDLGPVRSWLSWSSNTSGKWKGFGKLNVTKIEGKSLWTINTGNSISASLEYSRINNNVYLHPSKAMVRAMGYKVDYTNVFIPGGPAAVNAEYFALHTNPYRNGLLSLDGEFTLTSSLHLSVVPYMQYGHGGSGTGVASFVELPLPVNAFGATRQNLNGPGRAVPGEPGLAYAFTYSTIHRPGVVVTFKQDLGEDDSLQYGFWYEHSHQIQGQRFGKVNGLTGWPDDVWGKAQPIVYNASGMAQRSYLEDTTTTLKKAFVSNAWTPDDRWTINTGVGYLYATRSGEGTEYPGATMGQPNPNYNPKGVADPCDTMMLHVQCGGHADVHWHQLLPALGVAYQLNDQNQIYYGLGKTFRVPPSNAVYLNTAAGKPPTQPESSIDNDIGWRFMTRNVLATVMLYRDLFEHKAEQGFDQATGISYFVNIPKLRMQGINAEMSWDMGEHWSAYGSYAYTQATIEDNLNAGHNGTYPVSGNQLSNTPRNTGYLRVEYRHGGFWADVHGQYHGAFYGDYMHTEHVGGFSTFGLDAGYHFHSGWGLKHPYVKLNVMNLSNRRALTQASLNVLSQPGLRGVQGRSLYAGTTYYTLLEPTTVMVTFGASFL